MTAALVPLPIPTRADPRGSEPLLALFDRDARGPGDEGGRGGPTALRGGLTGELARRYDGDLRIPLRADRPTIVANFVETLDGVVAMDPDGRTGGGEVSGFSPTDRFTMGLLRALADVVLVGGSTIRSSGRAAWTPGGIFPAAEPAYAALRARLGLAPSPTTLVATASGDLDPDHPVFAQREVPIVIAASTPAAERLRSRGFGDNVSIEALEGDGRARMRGLVELAGRLGARVVLSEAGPRLFGSLARAGLLDELFLTVAPQAAGRDERHPRLALVEGAALWPDEARWGRLASVRRAGDHLFLRYQFEEQQ